METEIKDKTLVESVLHVHIELFSILCVHFHCPLFVSSERYCKDVKLAQKNIWGRVWLEGCQILWGLNRPINVNSGQYQCRIRWFTDKQLDITLE